MGRTITVIGLGAGDEEQLTVGVRRILESGKPLYLRTASHPAAVDLQNKGFVFRSFDNIYE
ncbi:hypothetical protein ACPWQS_24110, partial [Pandoraea pneumonica]|uniref:hypothetical protein n=1 Tax=Pandoraea pneumonica TaxID=2508299 RepID=UPI003CFA019D